MARSAPQYTVYFVDDDGDLEIATFGDDLDGAKARLLAYGEGKARLADRPPLQHRINRDPTVEIGEIVAPKKRGRKKKAAPVETHTTGGTLFADNGDPAPSPPEPKPRKPITTTPEA